MDTRMLAAMLAGLVFGLMNVAHCAGMCGPLAAAGCARTGRAGLVRYQLGRSVAYAYAGAIAGHVGQGISLYQARWTEWLFPLLTAAACVFAARGLLRVGRDGGLVQLRSAARSQRPPWLARLFSLLPRDPLPLGLLSVLLPCGLLAAALLAAVATGSGPSGASFMLGFAVSSGGAVLGTGVFAQLAARCSISARRALACALLAAAALTIARPLAANSFDPPQSPTHRCH
jgi:sulfite exporter TauE/SafE